MTYGEIFTMFFVPMLCLWALGFFTGAGYSILTKDKD